MKIFTFAPADSVLDAARVIFKFFVNNKNSSGSPLSNKAILNSYLLRFTLKSTTHALALNPKSLVVRSTDRARDLSSLKNGIVRRDYGIVCRDALALKPKPLVVRSRYRGRYPGSLKKWHRSPRLWHCSPRLSGLVTESEVTAQSLPCAFFALLLIPNDKDFLFAWWCDSNSRSTIWWRNAIWGWCCI